MLEVDVALGLVHEKEMAVRVACVDFDIAIARLRQTLQLPISKDAWVSSLATRLNFLNKEHRISVKNDLYALSARMQEVYSPKNATSDVLTLLDERIQEATEFLAMAESLMAECEALYDQRVSEKNLDVFERVRLRRSMPTIRKGIQKAKEHKEAIQTIMTEWRVYFRLYSCEAELSKFLEDLHTHKLTKTAAEEIATPVFERIVEISAARDKIVSESSAIGLQLEASWLTYGRGGVRERELRRVMRQYDALLESAETEKATQVAVMKEAEALAGLACSPVSISGPDGSQIFFDRLRNAYTQFKHIHVVCDSMQALLHPVREALRANIDGLRGDLILSSVIYDL